MSFLGQQHIAHGTVFEAGAHSPNSISNSRCFVDKKWTAYLVEADPSFCDEWNSLSLPNVNVFNRTIQYESSALDHLLSELSVPHDLDVLFLDIDGAEYQLLNGMSKFRPKVICVEYDNSYPLFIDFVPVEMTHGVKRSQASSTAFFKLMDSKSYIYIKSFFLDHIFVESSFYAQCPYHLPEDSVGLTGFTNHAQSHLYDPFSVCLNQADDKGGAGILFYQDKIDALISNQKLQYASQFYYMLSLYFQSLLPIVKANRATPYYDDFCSHRLTFDRKFREFLFLR